MTAEEKTRIFESASKALQASILSSYELAGQCYDLLVGCPDDIVRPFNELRTLLATAWNTPLPSKQQVEMALIKAQKKGA